MKITVKEVMNFINNLEGENELSSKSVQLVIEPIISVLENYHKLINEKNKQINRLQDIVNSCHGLESAYNVMIDEDKNIKTIISEPKETKELYYFAAFKMILSNPLVALEKSGVPNDMTFAEYWKDKFLSDSVWEDGLKNILSIIHKIDKEKNTPTSGMILEFYEGDLLVKNSLPALMLLPLDLTPDIAFLQYLLDKAEEVEEE